MGSGCASGGPRAWPTSGTATAISSPTTIPARPSSASTEGSPDVEPLQAFDYDLDARLVAQEPAPRRDASRLLVLQRRGGLIEHRQFLDLPDLLAPGDLLVVNDTKVLPCRLRARKSSGGAVELLLLEPWAPAEGGERRCLVRGPGRLRAGLRLCLAGGLAATLTAPEGAGRWKVCFSDDERLMKLLPEIGEVPLPPYIRRPARDDLDPERYQTIFAEVDGAVAAPTAGLHFTHEAVAALRGRGVEVTAVTLHVGPGTFQPVTGPGHRMAPEFCRVGGAAARQIRQAGDRGGRVVAVGTTVTRALEWAAATTGLVEPGEGWCDLFIRPGHRFRAIDALLTNFHLPRSTPLLLVSALAGRDAVLRAYREAAARCYRVYSYGDAMLVL
ncbi:MAG: tRNA preQ1(34) S-adenosylmethionine ribosyltransferase-isomerase QueA [Deltaproteobacteria bacterium]|nr:tRNA preQ1(34) S-adenosylmethionine ribosyltransferase-isomerase QueA [Deltaproteobacteria bacterium]